MSNLERKIPKLAAPLVLTAAALGFSACSKNEPKQYGPDIPPTPTMSGGMPDETIITSITTSPIIKEDFDAPYSSPTPKPVVEQPQDNQKQVAYDAENDMLVLTEQNYQYKLVPNWTLPDVMGDRSKHWLETRTETPQEIIDQMWTLYAQADNKSKQDANDQEIPTLLKKAALLLEPYCNLGSPSEVFITKGHVVSIASALYNLNPNEWPKHKSFFLANQCFTKKQLQGK